MRGEMRGDDQGLGHHYKIQRASLVISSSGLFLPADEMLHPADRCKWSVHAGHIYKSTRLMIKSICQILFVKWSFSPYQQRVAYITVQRNFTPRASNNLCRVPLCMIQTCPMIAALTCEDA